MNGWGIAALLLTGAAFGVCGGFFASIVAGGNLAFDYADWLTANHHADTDEEWLAQEAADEAAVVAVVESRDALAAWATGEERTGRLSDRVRDLYAAVDALRARFADRLMEASRYVKDEDDAEQLHQADETKPGEHADDAAPAGADA